MRSRKMCHRLAGFFCTAEVFFSLFSLQAVEAQPAAGDVTTTDSSAAGYAKVAIAGPIYDFGTVQQGVSVSHGFQITNVGAAPLLIRQVQPTCGCTAAVPDKNKLLRGESATVKVTFDTKGFEGYKVRTVRLYTNDPTALSTMLTMQGTVKADVELKPENLYFGKMRRGDDKTLTATVFIDKDSQVNISEISSKSDYLKLDVKDLVSGNQQGKGLTVGLREDVPVGVLRTRIVVKTTSKDNPVLQIPVFARVEGDLRALPSDVSFGLFEGPLLKNVQQAVTITNTSEKPIHILSLKSNNPFVTSAMKVIEEGKKYEVTVGVESGAVGTIRAEIDVITDHPEKEQSQLTIPVYGIISRKGT